LVGSREKRGFRKSPRFFRVREVAAIDPGARDFLAGIGLARRIILRSFAKNNGSREAAQTYLGLFQHARAICYFATI